MPTPEPPSLGTLLRRSRRAAAMSQETLAERAGVSARTISDLERGQRLSAHFETLRRLAEALSLSPDERTRLVRAGQGGWIDATLQTSVAAAPNRRRFPAAASRLVGRDREISTVLAALTSGETRLLTLTGPGGVGKTRLAMAVLAAEPRRFVGGVAWIDLSGVLDPGAVLTTIASEVGGDGVSPEAPEDEIRAIAGDAPFLLILDNFEQVLAATPQVVALLERSPGLTLLVTSRARLNVPAELELAVAPLDLPEPGATPREIHDSWSVRLFADRALRADAGFVLDAGHSATVAAICRQLGGLPLAIELAAARLNVMTPGALLDRLEQPLAILSRGPLAAPPRQQTMFNTIAWSYDLLDPAGQRLLRRLSVFVSGFTIETVEWVSDEPAASVAGTMADLVESGLITRTLDPADRGRFTMFAAIREFARAKLTEHREEANAYDRLASFCRHLSFYGEEVPTCIVPRAWAALMDRERGNIRAAYRHLAEYGDPERLLEFTGTFGHYLYNRGPYDEAWQWIHHALAVSSPAPRRSRLQVLYWATHFASHLGMAEEALRYGEEARGMATALGDRQWRAAAVHCLGLIHHERGAYDQAVAFYHEELRLWSELGIRGLSGFAYLLLGMIEFSTGDLEAARVLETRAAAIFAEMGGFGWEARAIWWQGLISLAGHDLRDAAAKFEESLRIAVEHDAFAVHQQGLVGLAFVAAELAMYDTAAQFIGAAEARVEDSGHNLGRYEHLLHKAAVATCRSGREQQGFEAARRLGAAAEPPAWLSAAGSVRQAATRWPGHGGAIRPGGIAGLIRWTGGADDALTIPPGAARGD